MSLNEKQFTFLVKQKAITNNTLIVVKVDNSVNISENYKRILIHEDEGLITNIYKDKKNKSIKVKYIKIENNELNYICNLDSIIKIEGQEADRYYKSYLDILANANPIIINNLTNIEKDVIGKLDAKVGNYEIYEGMKFILKNDINTKYNNKILNARNVGKKIKLTGNAGRPKNNRNN